MKGFVQLNWLRNSVLPLLLLSLAACGGGGGSSGGGGSDLSTPPPTQLAANVVPITVSSGGNFGALNSPFVSVTLCSPSDASNCITIDNVLVDTGSVGLRVFAQPEGTAPLSTLNLTQQTVAGSPIAECMPFVSGVTWGPIRYATVTLGQETANNVAIQVIADPQFSTVPTACSGQGSVFSATTNLRANGILGIGIFPQDCGISCTNTTTPSAVYFSCSTVGSSCVVTPQSLGNQVQHPVTLFSRDNNGVIVSLDAVPTTGAAFISGTLTFGVDTESNNASTNQNTVWINNNIVSLGYGYFNTTLDGHTYPFSFVDTGSNGFFFSAPDNISINPCPGNSGFYCPPSTLAFTATISGTAGSSNPVNVSFDIGNAQSLFANSHYFAFDDIGGNASDGMFDWGLPFFFGKSVVIVPAGSTTSIASGPYIGW